MPLQLGNAGGEFVDRVPRRVLDIGIGVGRPTGQQHDEADDLAIPPAIAPVIEPSCKGDRQSGGQAMARDGLAQIGVARCRRFLMFGGGVIDRRER